MKDSVHSGSEMAGESGGVTNRDRHRLLAVEQRHTVLEALGYLATPIDLDVLAVAVAQREADDETADPENIERMGLRLHHTHLPKMDDCGVIDYDPETHQITWCLEQPTLLIEQ